MFIIKGRIFCHECTNQYLCMPPSDWCHPGGRPVRRAFVAISLVIYFQLNTITIYKSTQPITILLLN